MNQYKQILVTGTDTNVGKTYISAALAKQLHREGVQVGVYKPCCSGSVPDESGQPDWPDLNALADALDYREQIDNICPQRFLAPLAPPVAAQQENRVIDEPLLTAGLEYWQQHAECTIVEGVGGLLCPLTDSLTVADWAQQLALALIVVADNKLGMINHTLMTLEIARKRGLEVLGIIINNSTPGDASEAIVRQSNPGLIEMFSTAPILCQVGHQKPLGLPRLPTQQFVSWREFLVHSQ